MNNKTTPIALTVLLLAAVGGVRAETGSAPAASQPYDAKVFSGALCQPHGGTQATEINYPHGAVNSTDHYVWVSCPFVRDNVRNENGTWAYLERKGVEVRVRNQAVVGSGMDLTCDLKSYSADTYLIDLDSGSVPPSVAQHGVIELGIEKSGDGGFYTLLCNLPPHSAVFSYVLKEYLQTGDDS